MIPRECGIDIPLVGLCDRAGRFLMTGENREVVATSTVPEAFRDAESYAATKAHELTHWTKHPSRLDRDFGDKRFGDAGYAREELLAELVSAFLCAGLGTTPEPREDHVAYPLARGTARRQVRDLLRRRPCAARRGFPPQPVPARGSDAAAWSARWDWKEALPSNPVEGLFIPDWSPRADA